MTKQLVVIYDGPDACGKTHMAQELARRTGVAYFKNQDEHRYFLKDPDYFVHAIRYVDTYFTSYLESSGVSVILDRAWPSEFVYSHVLGRKTDMGLLRELDDRHAALGTRLIIPYRTSYSRIRDDYKQVTDNIQRIHDRYMELAAWTKCDRLLLNVDDEDLDRETSETLAFLGV